MCGEKNYENDVELSELNLYDVSINYKFLILKLIFDIKTITNWMNLKSEFYKLPRRMCHYD